MSAKPKRNSLSILKKAQIIEKIEAKVPRNQVMAEFGLKSTGHLTDILKKKTQIMIEYQRNHNYSKKSLKGGKNPELDQRLKAFIFEKVRQKLPVTFNLVKLEAIKIADQLQIENFVFSTGYWTKLKSRAEIIPINCYGDAANVPQATVDEWIQVKLPPLIAGYKPCDIFNVDELGQFYKMLPKRSFIIKGQPKLGWKASKERITVMLACNSDGTEKLKPIVIGKFANPRVFKHKSIPVNYRFNRTAWMTEVIFTEFLTDLNRKMKIAKRNIIIFMDNFSGHPDLVLSNVKIQFLPGCTTSKLQPLDQGIIWSFKSIFKTKVLQKMATILEDTTKSIDDAKINLFDAVQFVKQSWDEVTPQTIINCFKESGFGGEKQIESDSPSSIGQELIDILNTRGHDVVSFQEFVEADNDTPVGEPLRADHFVTSNPNEQNEIQKDVESSDEEYVDVVQKPSFIELYKHIEGIRNWLSYEDFDNSFLKNLNELERQVVLKQH